MINNGQAVLETLVDDEFRDYTAQQSLGIIHNTTWPQPIQYGGNGWFMRETSTKVGDNWGYPYDETETLILAWSINYSF